MRPARTAVVTTVLVALVFSLRGDAAAGQQRLRRSIEGPVTREAVTRSLAVVPSNAGDPGGPAEVSLMLRIEFAFDSAELTVWAMRP